MRYALYALAGLVLVGLAILVVVLEFFVAPPKAYRVEARGVCELRFFHFGGLGEPSRERVELWCSGQRLADPPSYTSVSAEGDKIIFAEDNGSLRNSAAGGIYYFDARTGRKQRLRGYAALLNAQGEWPLSGIELRDASPWSPDGTMAVVSYDEILPPNYEQRKDALIVNLTTGATRDVSELLHVSRNAGVVFRGWSDHATLRFDVSGETIELPMSAAVIQ